jgi:hypothetical protein
MNWKVDFYDDKVMRDIQKCPVALKLNLPKL